MHQCEAEQDSEYHEAYDQAADVQESPERAASAHGARAGVFAHCSASSSQRRGGQTLLRTAQWSESHLTRVQWRFPPFRAGTAVPSGRAGADGGAEARSTSPLVMTPLMSVITSGRDVQLIPLGYSGLELRRARSHDGVQVRPSARPRRLRRPRSEPALARRGERAEAFHCCSLRCARTICARNPSPRRCCAAVTCRARLRVALRRPTWPSSS